MTDIDYTYDESKKTYTICHEELKNAFGGDASNEVEYKAIEDSRGNMQFRKSATFRSSKTKKDETDQTPFVHSVEKIRDKQWQEENLGNISKLSPALPSTSQNEEDNSQTEAANFPIEIEEEFGYYRQGEGWGEPSAEPTNVVYHRKREGDNVIERKREGRDSDQVLPVNPQITDALVDMEIDNSEGTKNFQQKQIIHEQQQDSSEKVATVNEAETSQQQVQQPPYKEDNQKAKKWFLYSFAALAVSLFAWGVWHGVKMGKWFKV